MARCPFCGYEADASGFRLLRSPWRFRFYEVKRLECPRCGGVFNYYHGMKPSRRFLVQIPAGLQIS